MVVELIMCEALPPHPLHVIMVLFLFMGRVSNAAEDFF
jgi:hypothetical protein